MQLQLGIEPVAVEIVGWSRVQTVEELQLPCIIQPVAVRIVVLVDVVGHGMNRRSHNKRRRIGRAPRVVHGPNTVQCPMRESVAKRHAGSLGGRGTRTLLRIGRPVDNPGRLGRLQKLHIGRDKTARNQQSGNQNSKPSHAGETRMR